MHIHLIAVGSRMPAWVTQGYETYAKRMPRECKLVLKEVGAGKRTKNANPRTLVKQEGERMLAAIPSSAHVVALDLSGKMWSTPQLADALQRWQQSGQDVALLVGGPEGIAPDCLNRATERWALSPLTYPHPLVRIIVAEQIYRAWSITQNHPYHR